MKTILNCVLAASLLSGGVVLTGCEKEVEVVTRTELEENRDEDTAELVTEQLSLSEAYKFPDVHVAVFKGRVQLSGFVLTKEQKQAAEDLARRVNGVLEVENKISIKE